nr:HAMP domain-containing sensor histidine kinase [Brevundimonas diminuta]
MRRLWSSFRVRLLLGSVIWISVGVAVSGFVLSEMFREHVTAQFDAELKGHADELVALVQIAPNGSPYLQRRLSDPRFQPSGSGYYWQIERKQGGLARSTSLDGAILPVGGSSPGLGELRQSFITGPTGEVRLLERIVTPAGSEDSLRIAIGADQRLLDDVLSHFNRMLALSLGVIALGLIAAAFLQVSFGLRPLSRVRGALAAVRAGRVARLPEDSPSEVRPLVQDLNALIDANAEMIRRARTQAGNLAHALKTPLAILADEGERMQALGRAEAHTILMQCERMRRQIDYQMARARAAASRSTPGAVAEVVGVLAPILSAMRRLHGPRGVNYELLTSAPAAAAVEAQDLSEMLANLLDNAGKWAAATVEVSVERPRPGVLRITIDDDGPGLAPEAWEVVFDIGERLDEHAPGTGLGLAIVRDLVTLYGGRAWLEAAPLGGLRAVLEVPAAPDETT